MQIFNDIKAGSTDALRQECQGDTSSVGPAFLFSMKSVPIPKTRNYFITPGGWVIKSKFGQDVRIPVMFKGRKRAIVLVDGKEMELIYLMIESFNIKYNPTDRLEYTVTDSGEIPLNSIKIIPIADQAILNTIEGEIDEYNCQGKCYSANFRGEGVISPVDVLATLKSNRFKCRYCGDSIKKDDWHLDHIVPLSKGGKNVFTNIVPACRQCNMMKSDFLLHEFIKKCKKISFRAKTFNI